MKEKKKFDQIIIIYTILFLGGELNRVHKNIKIKK